MKMTKKDLITYLLGLVIVFIITIVFQIKYDRVDSFFEVNWWEVLIYCVSYIICMYLLHFHNPIRKRGKK